MFNLTIERGLSAEGMKIEYFLIDPVIPAEWKRGVEILPRNPEEPDGVHDLVICIGVDPKQGQTPGYPSMWSFIEECRHFGASRKVPEGLEFHKLDKGKSRMVFIHPKARPLFYYKLNRSPEPMFGCRQFQDYVEQKKRLREGKADPNEPFPVVDGLYPEQHHIPKMIKVPGREDPKVLQQCMFAMRDLSYLTHPEDAVLPYKPFADLGDDKINPEYFVVEMPSFTFRGKYPKDLAEAYEWESAMFMALPLTHFEIPGSDPKGLEEKINQANYEVAFTEW
jgi:hypothetical protein